MPATLRLQYYRSAIGRSWRQKAIIRGLGFTKLQQIVVRPDNPGFRGMVAKVPHLVRIVAPGSALGTPAAGEKAKARS